MTVHMRMGAAQTDTVNKLLYIQTVKKNISVLIGGVPDDRIPTPTLRTEGWAATKRRVGGGQKMPTPLRSRDHLRRALP